MRDRDEARRGDGGEDARDTGEDGSRAAASVSSPGGPRVVVRPSPMAQDTHADGMADTAMSMPGRAGLGSAPTEAARLGAAETAAEAAADGDTRDQAVSDSLIGKTLLDRYRITGQIGQGGMGAVYEAEHTLIGKRVAVKVLLDKYAQKSPVVARLEQEARLASAIGHEHIVDITDFGETPDGRTFVVMEYLDGESLGTCLTREGRLAEDRAVRIAQQVASALSAAHAKGILHRDVKPENIFLLSRKGMDFVKVVDFGISKSLHTGDEDGSTPRLTQTGMVLGTPLYMSPEQARGEEDLDQRIDVYALGVILYEMVTGDVPFQGSNSLNIISRVLSDEPRPPRELRADLSPELEAVILHAMVKEREQRYASCDAMAADLAALLDDVSHTGRVRISAPLPARRHGRGGQRRRRKLVIAALAIAAIGTFAGGVSVGLRWMLGSPEPAKAGSAPLPAVAVDAGEPAVADELAPEMMPEPEVETALVHIMSEPPGASIHEGGRVHCQTPCDIPLPKKDQDVELVARLDGHADAAFKVNPLVDDERDVVVHLAELADAQGPDPQRPGRVTRHRRDGAKPSKPDGRTDSAGTGTAGGDLGGNPYQRTEKRAD